MYLYDNSVICSLGTETYKKSLGSLWWQINDSKTDDDCGTEVAYLKGIDGELYPDKFMAFIFFH